MPECICTICRGRKLGLSYLRPSDEYEEIYELYLTKMIQKHSVPRSKLIIHAESWKFHFDIMVEHAIRHGGFWVYNMGQVKAEQFVRIREHTLSNFEAGILRFEGIKFVQKDHDGPLIDKFLNQLVKKYT